MIRLALAVIATLALVSGCSLWPARTTEVSEAATEQPKVLVRIEGLGEALAKNVRAHLSLATRPCTISSAYLQSLAVDATKEIEVALQAFGHYEPVFGIETEAADGCALVTIVVSDLGPQVVVQHLEIEISGPAHQDHGFMSRITSMPLIAGQPLNHANYAKTKSLIQSLAAERGYLEGLFTRARLAVDKANRAATATLHFDSGPRYTFGQLDLVQTPDTMSEDLIHRFLHYPAGQAYQADVVTRLTDVLAQSGYFDQVDVRPRFKSAAAHAIPLKVSLAPRNRHTFDLGAGFSTDEGLRGKGAYLNRRLNRAGHRMALEGNASFVEQGASAEYRIPRADPRYEWLAGQLGVRRREVDSFTTVELQASVSETKRRGFGWLETRFISLNRQSFDVAAQEEDSLFLIPGVRWSRTETDDELLPTKGSKWEVEVRGAVEEVLSDTSFLSALVNGTYIRSVPFNGRIHLRGIFGGVLVDDFLRLPPSERFFAGGDNSIRGYDIEELGPEDGQGNVIGGIYLAVASVEYEHLLNPSWSIATFIDAGNAFGGEGSDTGVKFGAGFGLRWRSPVGPIRIDIASPTDDLSPRLHLRFGPDL